MLTRAHLNVLVAVEVGPKRICICPTRATEAQPQNEWEVIPHKTEAVIVSEINQSLIVVDDTGNLIPSTHVSRVQVLDIKFRHGSLKLPSSLCISNQHHDLNIRVHRRSHHNIPRGQFVPCR